MIIFLKALQLLFRLIFFLPAVIALGIMYRFAWLAQAIVQLTGFKRAVINNVSLVLPKRDAREIAARSINNISASIFELLCVPFFTGKHFQRITIWQGKENLDQALEQNKGAIILTMHVGNYELVHAAIAELGYPMNIVLRATDDPLFKIVNSSRSASGAKLINVLEADMYKESLKVLERNELIYLLADTGALESRHEYHDFLGHKVPMATGWLTLAQRAKCPVVPTLARRENGVNVITLFPPVMVTRDDRNGIIKKSSKIFEDFIIEYPEEWAMFLNSYETRRMMEGKKNEKK